MSKSKAQLAALKIDSIIPSGDNPRTINKKDPAFLELVESVKAQGVIVPVHVRLHPKGQVGTYELLAGERRLLAARQAGWLVIRAINHGELSDDEAFEITFAENFAREDLTTLEQGKAVATLMVRYKNDIEAVASKMGKSTRWVAQRASIHKNLSNKWKDALAENEKYKDWTASHIQEIAWLPKETQDQLLGGFDTFIEVPTVKELAKEITGRLMLLKKAPWDPGDAELVKKAGACSQCPKRSCKQPGLFDDVKDPEAIKKNDRCLDPKCWEAKVQARVEQKFHELKKKHPKLVALKTGYGQTAKGLKKRYGHIYQAWDHETVKKKTKGAVPALVVDGDSLGSIRYIRIRKSPQPAKPKKKTLKDLKAELEYSRWSLVYEKASDVIGELDFEKIAHKNKVLVVLSLAAVYGTGDSYRYSNNKKDLEELKGFLSESDSNKALQNAAAKLWPSAKEGISEEAFYPQGDPQTKAVVKYICELLGIDIAALKKEADEAIPEPEEPVKAKAEAKAQSPKNTKKKKPKKAGKKTTPKTKKKKAKKVKK